MPSQPNDLRAALQAALGEPYVIEREAGAADSLRSGLWMAARAFVVRDSAAGHRVVVNVVPDTIAAQVDAATFCREAQLATSLRHPHLIPLIGAGTAPHLLYYLTPVMDGESLRQRLDASGGKLPVLDAVRIAIDVAGALQAAHEQGMVHRDVTPENVFLAGAHAAIANVGLSRAVSRSLLKPPPGGLVGTPAYMSPEQMAGAANLDGRSDIYSLGCVLYEMLTGARPFAGVGDGTPREHSALLPEPAQRRRREIPRSLDTVLMKTLSSRPEDRYPTAAALGHALLDEVARRRGLPFRGVASILSMAKRALFPVRRKGRPS